LDGSRFKEATYIEVTANPVKLLWGHRPTSQVGYLRFALNLKPDEGGQQQRSGAAREALLDSKATFGKNAKKHD